MRCKLALAFVASSGIASALPAPAHAQALWVPVIPPEIGVGPPPARYGWIPFRCTDEVPNNFYHGAYYGGLVRPMGWARTRAKPTKLQASD